MIPHRPAVPFLVAAGLASLLLALPVSWPGFGSWPARATTLTPADTAGQTLILEFEHPARIEFPASIEAAQDARHGLTALITVLSSSSPAPLDVVPAQIDAARSVIRVPLTGLDAAPGATLHVVLSDPGGQVWIQSSEHDRYPGGSRSAGDQPTGGDLAFRVTYRRTLLDLLLQGLAVALRSWRTIAAAVVILGAAGLLAGGALRRVEGLDPAARLSGGIGLGLVLTTLVGWVAAALRLQIPDATVGLLAAAMAVGGLCLCWRSSHRVRFDPGAAGLITFLALLTLLRLAFASPLILPPHIDAVEHFAIVTDFLAPGRLPLAENQVARLTAQYYHFGFHGLAALVLRLAGDVTPSALAVLGQLLQAAAIATLYFPMIVAVQDRRAALGAVVLAGVGWTMPAYASNWSRYPALLSLGLLPTAVALGILAWRAHGTARWVLGAAAGLVVAAVGLAHTRMPFLLAALFVSALAARRLTPRPGTQRFTARIALPIAAAMSLAAVLFLLSPPLQRASVWDSLGEYLKGQGAVTSALVACGIPFAFRKHPQAALASILWIASTLLLLFLPPKAAYPLPLLDATLVRMALYLPMSALGGLGLSGLSQVCSSAACRPTLRRVLGAGLPVLGVLVLSWALSRQAVAPVEGFLIAGPDDVAVARQASQRLGPQARIAIPSQAEVDYSARAVDGGAWLRVLTGLHTVLWPAGAELASPEEHRRLCAAGITHIYVGSAWSSYAREELDFAGGLYAPLLTYPNAALYSVVGCAPLSDAAQP